MPRPGTPYVVARLRNNRTGKLVHIAVRYDTPDDHILSEAHSGFYGSALARDMETTPDAISLTTLRQYRTRRAAERVRRALDDKVGRETPDLLYNNVGRKGAPRMLTADGRTQSIKEWADETGLSPQTINSRLAAGWEPARAVRAPRGGVGSRGKRYEYQGRSLTLSQWATFLEVPPTTFYAYVRRHSFETAMDYYVGGVLRSKTQRRSSNTGRESVNIYK